MKHLITTVIFLVASLTSCQSDGNNNDPAPSPSGNIVNYQASNEVFSNPERGFVHQWEVFSEGNAMSPSSLANLKSENVSLIWRMYYLEKFKTTPLSQVQLDLIKTDLGRLRDAGVKCVLRFAYTNAQDGTDASFAVISGHLDQLKPIMTENADVIAFVQAGFIGAWGEWYYTTNNLTTQANRKLVLDKLLETFPKEIKIQLRTPKYKYDYVGNANAMESGVGYGTTNLARLGFHNDCFMASDNDYGTYENVAVDKAYMSKEAVFVPTGGETCPPSGVSIASCNKAETEMALLKWSYLNLDYYGPVLQEWRNNLCFTDFERKLGYRLTLVSSNIKTDLALNSAFELNAVINNVGFAPVYNTKNTFLVFKSVDNGTIYKKKMNFDVRYVTPKSNYAIKESIATTGIPAGKYELLLKIEDASIKLSDRPEYSIRLANKELWDAATGMNKLTQTVTIK